MAVDKYIFKEEVEGVDFKNRQIKLEKTVKQFEFFSIHELELMLEVCDANIATEGARKVEIQAKIDAATTKLS